MSKIIRVDATQRELAKHGTFQFPLEVNHDDLSTYQGRHIRCHWHEELEISIVRQGTAVYTLGGGVFTLAVGQGILINSKVPHTVVPQNTGLVRLLTVIVHPSLICGPSGSSSFELMYPFLRAKALASILLEEEELRSFQIIADLENARPFAWQLKCKELLCGAFFHLLTRHRPQLGALRPSTETDLEKLKAILAQLHSQYSEPFVLAELAADVGLSREGCCRFFKRMTGQTISQYLEDYRIAQGIHLLRQGKLTITEIALGVGFSNAGRFSAAFAKRMHCTPRQYLHDLPDYSNQSPVLKKA